MEFETDDIALEKCKSRIGQGLGWGDSARWHTEDFETLSNNILAKTGVTLSVATLKRLWGKIRYDSKPTPTTLNTLAQYLGYENWRSFRVSEDANRMKHVRQMESPPPRLSNRRPVIAVMTVLLLIGTAAWLLIALKERPRVDSLLFSFSSKKVVDEGVPNTVIFDYDAAAASPTDSVFIQQSWDTQLSRQVPYDQRQHTSIYYYPGFFEAKLVVNGQIVKEHNLLITTTGWLPLVEQKGTPIYFKQDDAIHDGILQLSLDKIRETNIPLQPVTPWTAYYIVQDFGGLTSDDVVFETALRNDYKAGVNACQYVEIRLQFEGPAVLIPLSAKGCVANLGIADTDGTERDLSAFGNDFTGWVNVKCVIRDKIAEIFVDNKSAIKLKVTGGRAKMVEVGFRFQGTGSVDFVKLSDNSGKVFYQEQFGD
ncbi:MAG TPA: hypothetical protein VK508_07640 [Cyclobacteriaceae bacterium]|nr:hypothetical protein [Cyclobacteriaceae bacterium]